MRDSLLVGATIPVKGNEPEQSPCLVWSQAAVRHYIRTDDVPCGEIVSMKVGVTSDNGTCRRDPGTRSKNPKTFAKWIASEVGLRSSRRRCLVVRSSTANSLG